MKIVVTGATGFFGPAIVARLREDGHDVVAASRRSAADPVDVADAESCRRLFERHPDTDVVVHAAALAHVPPGAAAAEQCQRVNVEGTRHIADAARASGVRRFVFISSITVYGDDGLAPTVTEASPAASRSLYGAAKRDAEAILTAVGAPMPVWILRMATMYAPDWLFNIRKRVCPPVIGRWVRFSLDPHRPRYSLCSRRNGAEVVAWAAAARLPANTYNVADDHVYSQGEILAAVERIEGVRPRLPVPLLLPRAAVALSSLAPAGMHDNARSRYWKFCERNVYSTAKLASHGLVLPPDLLTISAAVSA